MYQKVFEAKTVANPILFNELCRKNVRLCDIVCLCDMHINEGMRQ